MVRTTIAAIAALVLALPAVAAAAARERAIEQIPELMGRILESQEEIREREAEMAPVVKRYDSKRESSRRDIERASDEEEAAEALVDYVEAYASRLQTQQEGLRSIQGPLVRMRADARELTRAAEDAGAAPETPEEREAFFADHFQGVAVATGELATRLGREVEAATTGAVLQASWATHGAAGVPLTQMGPEGARGFARQVEGLYARYVARSSQLRAERRSVRRLLDVLIQRQLGRRLDALFSEGQGIGLGSILTGDGKSQDWQDLGDVVRRTLGLPSGDEGGAGGAVQSRASLNRLDYFARGGHRED